MFRRFNLTLASSSSMRFITPPGDTPAVLVSAVARKNRPSVSKMALRACGVSPAVMSSEETKGRNNNNNKEDDENSGDNKKQQQQRRKAPGLNTADLTDEEVTRCLRVLPHYCDLATSEYTAAASLRSLTRDRLRAANNATVQRTAMGNLRLMLFQRGHFASMAEANETSVADIRRRFGHLGEVRAFVDKFCGKFVVDVDEQLRR